MKMKYVYNELESFAKYNLRIKTRIVRICIYFAFMALLRNIICLMIEQDWVKV